MPLVHPSAPVGKRLWPRLAARIDAWTAAPNPPLAIEFAARGLAASRQSASGAQIVSRALAPGLVAPSAVRPNLVDPEAVASSLRALLAAVDVGAGNAEALTLLVPDLTARLSILDFDMLPARRDELAPLARFRLRKSLPFAEEQAVISCQALSPTRLLVAVADRARIDEYENCLEAAGIQAGVVLPSGLACLAAEPGLDDRTLLIRAEAGSLTTAFSRSGTLAFFRVVELTAPATFDDVFPSIAFFRDHTEATEAVAGSALSSEDPAETTLALYAAGLSAELQARLRREFPALALRVAAAPEQLAVAGALRGHFA